MTKIKLILLILTLLSISSLLFAGGFALTGVGSRATSMGGAFRGLANDGSAMYWNPAGLGFMEGNMAELSGTFIYPSGKWDATGTPYAVIPGFGGKEYEAKKSLRSFPNAIVTMATNPKFKYGLGVFVPFGLGTTWDIYNLPTAHPVHGALTYVAGFPSKEMKSSIAVVDVHPSVAYQFSPMISAGLGASVYYGSIELGKIALPNPADPFQVMSSDMSGSGLGFGGNLGVMIKPTEKLSLGLSGKLPATLNLGGDGEVYLWTYAHIDTAGVSHPAFKLGGKSDLDAELNLPADIGVGFSYKVMPNWLVNLDYSYTMWSAVEEVVVDFDDPINIPSIPPIAETTVDFSWEDTHRISIGTEYLMGQNAFRGGFFYDQSPIPEKTQSPTLSDISDKFSFNLGYGHDFGKFTLDTNIQYIMFPEREVDTASASNMLGKYNTTSMSGNIGLGYRF